MKYLIADLFFLGVFCFGMERVYNFVVQGIENLLQLPKYCYWTVEDLLLARIVAPVIYTAQTVFRALSRR